MFIKIIVTILLLSIPTHSYAKPSLYDLVVGGTIKTLAKIYVKTTNLKKLKSKYIKVIAKMKEDRFHKNYAKFYNVYKQLPADLKEKYAFNEVATKTEVIAIIERAKKKDLLHIISKVPSEFIMDRTRYYARNPDSQQDKGPKKVDEMYLWKNIIKQV